MVHEIPPREVCLRLRVWRSLGYETYCHKQGRDRSCHCRCRRVRIAENRRSVRPRCPSATTPSFLRCFRGHLTPDCVGNDGRRTRGRTLSPAAKMIRALRHSASADTLERSDAQREKGRDLLLLPMTRIRTTSFFDDFFLRKWQKCLRRDTERGFQSMNKVVDHGIVV